MKKYYYFGLDCLHIKPICIKHKFPSLSLGVLQSAYGGEVCEFCRLLAIGVVCAVFHASAKHFLCSIVFEPCTKLDLNPCSYPDYINIEVASQEQVTMAGISEERRKEMEEEMSR